MRMDPRVIKWTTLKLGHRPEDMVETGEMTVDRYARHEFALEMDARLTKLMAKSVMDGP
jgi:hypothetical protein